MESTNYGNNIQQDAINWEQLLGYSDKEMDNALCGTSSIQPAKNQQSKPNGDILTDGLFSETSNSLFALSSETNSSKKL